MSIRIGPSWTRPRPGRETGSFAVFAWTNTKDKRQREFALGLLNFKKADLELIRSKGNVLDLTAVGVLRFSKDVTPELVRETIGKTSVTGFVLASPDVKRALER
jgi:hypothetical protein